MIPNTYTFFKHNNYFNHVLGDVVDLGFGLGHSCSFFLDLIHTGKLEKCTLWSYDSFEGFPEPSTTDKSSKRNPRKGQWSIPIEHALELKEKYQNVDFKIIKGFVEDTLPNVKPSKIKVLNIDLDIQPGYEAALKHLYDLVEPSGLIMFDEYDETYEDDGTLKWPGAKLAIDSFLINKNRIDDLVVYPNGRAYIIK